MLAASHVLADGSTTKSSSVYPSLKKYRNYVSIYDIYHCKYSHSSPQAPQEIIMHAIAFFSI
jgi:hypothetical protein